MRILLRDLTPGTNYTLQLRQNDGTNVSDWSRIFELLTTTDTLAPAQVTGVTWLVNRSGFVGKWDATTLNADTSPCNDFSHYVVRITSPSSGTFDVRTTNNFYDLSFEGNKSLFGTPQPDLTITIFAVDIAGNMSVASASVNAVNPAPPDPTNVQAAGIVGGISLLWDVQTIDDLEAYDIYTSTSGSGFIPDSSNLVWSGTSNSYVHETNSLGVVNYFKIRSRDVFGSISNYVTVSATPISPVAIDTTPPAVPTGLGAVMVIDPDDSAFANATVSWTAVGDTDLAGYVVRYKPSSGTSYNYVNVPVGNTSVVIEALIVGIQYDFSIQAFDQLSNRSAWSSTVNATAANTAPSTPAAATAVASTQSVQVSHDLQKATTGRLESDVTYLEVHLGTSSGFTADDSNLIGSMQVEPGNTFVSAVFTTPVVDSSVDRWVRVIAVDRGGLKSSQSAVSAVTVGLILNANIANATITSAKINDLEANKITAGTGIINNLLIKSSLTVDTAGIVKSSNYSAGVSGWQLTNNTLEINQGVIKAAALELQDAPNIVLPEYADYEFYPSFYATELATSNDGGTSTVSIATSPEITAKFNTQVLKHVWTGGGSRSRAYNGSSITDYNHTFDPNTDYIFSAYFRVAAGSGTLQAYIGYRGGSGAVMLVANAFIPDDGAWHRVSDVFNSGAETTYIPFTSIVAAGTIYVDGIQIERKLTGEVDPSPWRPPSFTRIDGGVIRTGSIISTAAANGLGGQPAWSINTAGGAQFGDAAVRGRLVVGDISNPSGDGVNSRIHSANYSTGVSGWIIRNDGSAEFADIVIRSSDGSGNTVQIANGEFLTTNSTADDRVKLNFAGLTFWDDLNNVGAEIKLESTNGQAGFFARSYLIPFNTYSILQGGRLEMGSIGSELASSAAIDMSAHLTDWVGIEISSGRQDLADSQASLVVESDHSTGESYVQIYGDTVANVYFDGVLRRGSPSSFVDQGKGLIDYTAIVANTGTVTTTETVGITSASMTFENGRAYKIHVHGLLQSSVVNDVVRSRTRRNTVSGTILMDTMNTVTIQTANTNEIFDYSQIVANTSGSNITSAVLVTYHRIAGSGNVRIAADAANPAWIEIRDIGLASDYPNAREVL